MKCLLIFGLILSVSVLPEIAQAASVQTFPINEAISRNIDGCGYQYTSLSDFQAKPNEAKAFIFVNDGEKGLIKIEGQFIVMSSADNEGRGTYESSDHKVRVEPHSQIGPKLSDELWVVDGTLTFIINGHSQTIPIKGYMGC